jgi:hypothetical protein
LKVTGLCVCLLLNFWQAAARNPADCQLTFTQLDPSVCIGGSITLLGGTGDTKQGNGTTDGPSRVQLR